MSSRTPLAIACPNFTTEEKQSVRALLRVLHNFLPVPCEVTEEPSGDITLVNLDADAAPVTLPEGAFVIGCASKPREHPPRTIHQPVRPSSLLALVSDYMETSPQRKAYHPANGQTKLEWSYQLKAWPLDFQSLPREYWRVLAYLSRHNAHLREITYATGLAPHVIDTCLRHLLEQDLLKRSAHTQTPAPAANVAAPSGWRRLANRISMMWGGTR
ncbi:MAG: hypothetical protein Q4G62_01125 [Pseudomonadota bacterium]|nr:hypothetical protein [Pseudomonadota bacterium]